MLKLRNIWNFRAFKMNKDDDDTLTVTHDDKGSNKTVLAKEITNHSWFVDTVLTADIFINGKQNGITVFIGEGLTPEMVGVK